MANANEIIPSWAMVTAPARPRSGWPAPTHADEDQHGRAQCLGGELLWVGVLFHDERPAAETGHLTSSPSVDRTRRKEPRRPLRLRLSFVIDERCSEIRPALPDCQEVGGTGPAGTDRNRVRGN